jgi:RND family efflux transporter MFP subunit
MVSYKFLIEKFPRPLVFKSALLIAGLGVVSTVFLKMRKTEVPDEDLKLASVSVVEVERADVRRVFRVFAALQPWKEAAIRPTVQGVVRELLVEVGQSVKENQPVVRMDSEAQRLRAELEAIDLETRGLDFKVAMALAKKDFLSKQERKQKMLEHRAHLIRARLSELESRGIYRSPIKGLVSEVGLKVGDYLESSSQAAIRVVDLSRMKASIWIPQSVAKSVRVESEVRLKMENDIVPARILAISPTVDQKSGSVFAEVEVRDRPEAWRAGQFVEVLITVEHRPEVLTVPKAAVFIDQGQPAVFLVRSSGGEKPQGEPSVRGLASDDEADVLVKVPLQIGLEEGDKVEVVQGLEELDQVVIEGATGLSSGTPVEISY